MKWSDFVNSDIYSNLIKGDGGYGNSQRFPIGVKIGKETIVEYLGYIHKEGSDRNLYYYKCMCSCGNPEPQVHNERELKKCLSGIKGTISCGCAHKEKHFSGPSSIDNSIKNIYWGIKNDCYTKSSYGYQFYGAKGITVCDDWLKDNRQFIQWSKNAGYTSGDVLRRKDTNIGFNPDNCYYSKPGKSAFKITYSGSTEFLS